MQARLSKAPTIPFLYQIWRGEGVRIRPARVIVVARVRLMTLASICGNRALIAARQRAAPLVFATLIIYLQLNGLSRFSHEKQPTNLFSLIWQISLARASPVRDLKTRWTVPLRPSRQIITILLKLAHARGRSNPHCTRPTGLLHLTHEQTH